MVNFEKSLVVFLLFALLFLLYIEKNSHAQEVDRTDILKIQSDPGVDTLMESHDFAKAEQVAREKNLDPRVIATILAHAGKKNEAFAMFRDIVKSAPENDKVEIAYQCINLLNNVSPNLGKEFFDMVVKEGIVSLTQDQEKCAEIVLLTKIGDVERAKLLFGQLIDSDYAGADLIPTAMTLIGKLSIDISHQPALNQYVEKLQKKFPNDLRFKLQAIDLLSLKNPSQALVDLDQLQDRHPEFCLEMKNFILLIKGGALETLGEIERAKSIYGELKGTELESTAIEKINEYEERAKMEKELQEKIAESNQLPQYDITPRSPHRFWIILTVNVILLAVIAYMVYRRNRRRS